MVLLQLLSSLAPKHGWRLFVAHFNHRLRARSSDADQRLVERYVDQLGLRCVSGAKDVKAIALKTNVSVEMAARTCRHDFLARTARRLRCSSIAMAHHEDDNVELFFIRLFRGSGDEGLGGMRWSRPSTGNAAVQLVRPLLDCTKAEIRQWADHHRIPYREDASNRSIEFRRNKIRLQLLPLLRDQFQPSLNRVVARVSDIAAGNADFVTEAADVWLKKREPAFEKVHPAVQRRVMIAQLISLGIPPEFGLAEFLRLNPNRRASAGRSQFISRQTDGTVRLEESPRGQATVEPLAIHLGTKGGVAFGNWSFTWEIFEDVRGIPTRQPGQEIFDADRVGPVIVLRCWQAGDRFQPSGLFCSVKLQDLFTNAKVSKDERRQLAIGCTAAGELFWVERLRIAEPFKVTSATKRRLLWRWKAR